MGSVDSADFVIRFRVIVPFCLLCKSILFKSLFGGGGDASGGAEDE